MHFTWGILKINILINHVGNMLTRNNLITLTIKFSITFKIYKFIKLICIVSINIKYIIGSKCVICVLFIILFYAILQ